MIDDHPVFRAGFAALVGAAWPDAVLLLAESGAAGLALLSADSSVVVAIIDIRLPDRDGFDVASAMGAIRPSVPRILISGREDIAARMRARGCGAAAFIAKSSPAEAMIATIQTVLAGGDGFADAAEPSLPVFSPRQIEVLELLAGGSSNQQICATLGIADRTVRAHLTDIFDQLGVQNRVQAILQAQRLGIVR